MASSMCRTWRRNTSIAIRPDTTSPRRHRAHATVSATASGTLDGTGTEAEVAMIAGRRLPPTRANLQGCRRPARRGSKSDRERRDENPSATEIGIRIADASALTCRSEAAAIVPNRPRAGSVKDWSTRRNCRHYQHRRHRCHARPPIADELAMSHHETEIQTPSSSAPAWTEPEVQDWDPEITRQRDLEIKFGGTPERVIEREPHVEEVIEPRGREYWRVEPVDPDLPPSRTQRSRIPAVPAPPSDPGEMHGQERGGARVPPPSLREPRESQRPLEEAVDPLFEPSRGRGREPERERDPRKGRGRGRPSPPQGRPRPMTPPDRDKPLSPGSVPGIGPDDVQGDLDIGEASRIDEPPRRRGGRAAIRSRGGEEGRPLDLPPAPDQGTVRPARAYPAPSDFEIDRGRPVVPERPADSERRRTPEPPEPGRDRDRLRPHDRAGEPGYVPRRERLRSADSTFGAELFPSGPEWPERDIEPELENEIDAGAQEVTDEDEPGFLGDAGPAGPGGPTKNDGRRRRRRRGRRREPERGPAKFEPSIPSADERDSDSDEFSTARSAFEIRGRNLNPSLAGDLDELDLEEIDERDALDDDFIGDELVDERPVVVEEEIDLELEQEIRKEIEEIEELEREMGLRGPAEPAGRRGDEPARGGRAIRGRGLVKPPIQEIFRRGDEVLVQVIKESIGTKGPTLSTYISIPGRYLVLMPGLNRVGVSRKIVDESQRRKLREIMHELNPPKGLGFIVRTAGLERTKRELARDLAYLLRLWKVILRRIKKSKAPTPIYQESDMIIRTIRDIFTSEIDTIWIDEPLAFERAQDFLKVVMPRFVNRLKLYDEKVPLFHKYGIEEEIAKIQRRHVPLPEGGSIVIDQTEALVAIDVNSGNFRVEDDAERTAYEMNLRAAKEIARQLRLRDLGGVIVNDFIDMREERHRRGVERALRESIQRDRARTKVLRMSAFGLIEMTRQRIRPSLKRSIYEDCSHCAGAGVAKTVESMAIDVMRLLALATHREDIRRIAISVNPHVATYLSNRKRKEIARIESECGMTIQVGFEHKLPAEFLQNRVLRREQQ